MAAALAGATAAVVTAAEGPAHHARHARHTTITSVAAAYLSTSPAQLHRELATGRSLAQIANATSGKSASGLIQALARAGRAKLAAGLVSRIARQVDAVHGGTLLGLSASYLDMGLAQLRRQLRTGRTLAQIAAATPGHSEAGLIEALTAARAKTLNADASAGALSRASAQRRIAQLKARLSARVHRFTLRIPASS